MNNQTLSVCMIVRNESKMLPRCLKSVAWADQIIVVDTGSTDDTLKIARDHGAMVFTLPWPHDFAAARNESLKHATSDWILVLDADEWLAHGADWQIRRLIGVNHANGYTCLIRNYMSDFDRSQASEHYHVRLFRNKPHYRFHGAIHESIVSHDPNDPFEPVNFPGLLILHDGYRPEVFKNKDKHARNKSLLMQSVEREPENAYCWYNLCQSQWDEGDLASAQASILRCLSLLPDENSIIADSAWIKHLYLTQAIDGPAEASQSLQQAPEACQMNPDYWNCRAGLAMALKDLSEALRCFEIAASMNKPDFFHVGSYDQGNLTWKPYLGMAQVSILRGYPESAAVYLDKAMDLSPGNPVLTAQKTSLTERLPWLAFV